MPLNESSRATLLVFALLSMLGLSACALSGPPPTEYVLGAVPAANATTIVQTGMPIVEVKRVRLPDYLDSTDILERKGNRLIPSAAGRWGERLSVGFTRALAGSLASRLPRLVVTAASPIERPAWQVLVDVAAFERVEAHVVLVARWSIVEDASHNILNAEQASLVEAVSGTEDSAVVNAMSRLVEQLADRLAAGIKSDRRPK